LKTQEIAHEELPQALMRLGHDSMLPQVPLRLVPGKKNFLLVFQAGSA